MKENLELLLESFDCEIERIGSNGPGLDRSNFLAELGEELNGCLLSSSVVLIHWEKSILFWRVSSSGEYCLVGGMKGVGEFDDIWPKLLSKIRQSDIHLPWIDGGPIAKILIKVSDFCEGELCTGQYRQDAMSFVEFLENECSAIESAHLCLSESLMSVLLRWAGEAFEQNQFGQASLVSSGTS